MAIITMEVTKEEMDIILSRRREKEKKKAIAEKALEDIRLNIQVIEDMGYGVRLPHIGGQYETYRRPKVQADNISLVAK